MKLLKNKFLQQIAAFAVLTGVSITASAGPTHAHGRINNITFVGNEVMIMLDAPLPDNCIGTNYGWMKIPAEYKTLSAFVLGLWMRGDAAQTQVAVYTQGMVDGYCHVYQIDPVG